MLQQIWERQSAMQFDYREGVFSGLEAGVMASFFMAQSVKLLQVFLPSIKTFVLFSSSVHGRPPLKKKKSWSMDELSEEN